MKFVLICKSLQKFDFFIIITFACIPTRVENTNFLQNNKVAKIPFKMRNFKTKKGYFNNFDITKNTKFTNFKKRLDIVLLLV